MNQFPFFLLDKQPEKRTALLYLNKPQTRNAMDWTFWRDLPLIVKQINQDDEIRAVVIAGKGKSFSLGLDLIQFAEQFEQSLHSDTADTREKLHDLICLMQEGFKEINRSKKIFICAVHKHCIGGAVDLACACDIRFASHDAIFSVRETKVAIVADMGTLNRLPLIIGQGNARYMALSGDDFSGSQALKMGLVSDVFDDQEKLLSSSMTIATKIASNPRLATSGTKEILNYMEGHSPEDGMRYVSAWNAAYLDSSDFREMLSAFRQKRKPNYS